MIQERRQRLPVRFRQRRRLDHPVDAKGHLTVGQRLEPGRLAIVERHAEVERAERFRLAAADEDRHRGNLQDAVRLRPERGFFPSLERLLDARNAAKAVGLDVFGAELGQHPAAAIGDDQEIGIDFAAVLLRNRFERGDVGFERGGLDQRKIRDQPGLALEVVEEQGAVFIDQRSSLEEAALQLVLRLACHRAVHEVDGDAGR